MEYYIGVLSGTSADSIDAVLADFGSVHPRLLARHSHPWPAPLRTEILALSQSAAPVVPARLAQLDVACGEIFAAAILALLQQSGIQAAQVRAVGSHGQTLYHAPEGEFPYTWQIGNPNVIAERTGIATVADFRRRDVAAGGQGAPLVPAFHHAVFASPTENRVVLNLGGIANVTLLPAGLEHPVTGFDCGPANALLDAWAQRHLQQPFDAGGTWAASGNSHPALLERLLQDPYFAKPPPKTTGRDYFNLDWLEPHLTDAAYAPVDIQATLSALTVTTVSRALGNFAPQALLVCGGGVHNTRLLNGLRKALPRCRVDSTVAWGLDPDWVEALCFAWLAKQRLARRPGNLPGVTGAAGPRILGGIYAPAYVEARAGGAQLQLPLK